jgi:hypothetical protein
MPGVYGRERPLKCASPTLRVESNAAIHAVSQSTHFAGVSYETIACSPHRCGACGLCREPDRPISAAQHALECFDCAYRGGKRSEESCRHGPAGTKLSGTADTAQWVWHQWLYSCDDCVRWKCWHAVSGERQLTCCITIRRSLLPALQQIVGQSATDAPYPRRVRGDSRW